MAIIFGDLDPLASVESTRSVYRAAKSEYLLWRPVKGNSHIELTMGHDIRQICYDIKNLDRVRAFAPQPHAVAAAAFAPLTMLAGSLESRRSSMRPAPSKNWGAARAC